MDSIRTDAERGRRWVVVLETGDEVISSIEAFAHAQQIEHATFRAIGALRNATLGYFDWDEKEYRRIPVRQQAELLSLAGSITRADGTPKVHAHAVLGRSDGNAVGGHLLEGIVRPTLEMELVESPARVVRTLDRESGLPLIDVEESSGEPAPGI